MTIRTKYYAQCDVCSEEFGPFENEREAVEATNSWFKLGKGVIAMQCHTAECVKIALDDADELFKNSSPIGLRVKHPHDHGAFVKGILGPFNAPAGPGDYMHRQYGKGGRLLAPAEAPADYRTSDAVRDSDVEESQSGKHGEKEQ